MGILLKIAKMSPIDDNKAMSYKIKTTAEFQRWFNKLKDPKTKARINLRLRQVSMGHLGDHKVIAAQLYELRLFFGAGYRIYYTIKGDRLVILFNGGDKSSQKKDIAKAKQLLEQLEE